MGHDNDRAFTVLPLGAGFFHFQHILGSIIEHGSKEFLNIVLKNFFSTADLFSYKKLHMYICSVQMR